MAFMDTSLDSKGNSDLVDVLLTAAAKTILGNWKDTGKATFKREHIFPVGWATSFSSYYKYIPTSQTWVEAEIYCQSLTPGAHLASVHSLEENNFIQQLVLTSAKGNPYVWIGGSDCHKKRVFMWTDGSLWDFQKWKPHEPNNSGGREPCLQFNYDKPGMWNDEKCSGSMPFVCKVYSPLDFVG
ncbi:lectin-like [Lissotriton helveticus]